MAIYPPIIDSSMPAFISSDELKIKFTLSQLMNIDEVKHIQIRVVQQSNNKSIVDTMKYPDGIIYKNISTELINQYAIINLSDLDTRLGWNENTYYKVQLRFGKNLIWDNVANFANWKSEQITNSAFSEWSTVMALKCIPEPTLDIYPAGGIISPTQQYTGIYSINGGDEILYKYCFTLMQDRKVLENSDWILYDNGNDNNIINQFNITHRFKYRCQIGEIYTIKLQIKTINNYEQQIEYNVRCVDMSVEPLTNITLTAIGDAAKAAISLQAFSDIELMGNFIISRADETTNFTVWDDIYSLTILNEQVNRTIFTDYTIENGISYKYAIQKQLNKMGMRSKTVESNMVKAYIEDRYLFASGHQLKLAYNNEMSSFKHTVFSSKQDTLGGKYPVVLRNGNAYYAEFPVTGLISLFEDEEHTFLQPGENGYYYNSQQIISYEEFNSLDTNLTNSNIYIEKQFRDAVETFLNDGKPKLFKSATEGNKLIALTDVSLSPNDTLGRMIYSFSANAVEIGENSIENLQKTFILDVLTFYEEFEEQVFGQYINIDTTDIIQNIKDKYNGELELEELILTSQDIISEPIEININGRTQYFRSEIPYIIQGNLNTLSIVSNVDILIDYKGKVTYDFSTDILEDKTYHILNKSYFGSVNSNWSLYNHITESNALLIYADISASVGTVFYLHNNGIATPIYLGSTETYYIQEPFEDIVFNDNFDNIIINYTYSYTE